MKKRCRIFIHPAFCLLIFEELFQTANVESGEINQALRAAGPITEGNREQALESIRIPSK